MFKNHLVIAIRNISRNKSYSLVNVACLALGLACVIIISLWVQEQLSYDDFHANANRLYRLAFTTEQRDFHGYRIPGLVAEHLKSEYPEIDEATNHLGMGAETKIAYGNASFLREGAFVDPSFFRTFTFPFSSGSPEDALASPMSIVITESLARSVFGDEDPMGKMINVGDMAKLMVTGVLEDPPDNTHLRFDFLLSFEIAPPHVRSWDNKVVYTYILLHEGSSYREVSEKIAGVYNDHNPGAFPNYLYLQPIGESRLNDLESGYKGEPKIVTYVYILSAIALAILLIACINFMNLSTARWHNRAREIGIRKVVGSSRGQLVRQFLTESTLLSLFALVLAGLAVELGLPTINEVLGVGLEFELTPGLVLGVITLAVFTGLAAGAYPALFLSSFRPISILQRRISLSSLLPRGRGGARGLASRRLSLQKALVVLQFALSTVLIIAVAVLGKQLEFISDKDMGYAKDEIVILRLHGNMVRQCRSVKAELLKNPDIEAISLTLSGQTRWAESCGIDWDGKDPGNTFDVGLNRVDYDYMDTFGLEMAAGRFFSEAFPSDESEAFVINEAAVRAMGITDPVGKSMSMPALNRTGTIVGVVKDYHTESLHKEVRPFVLVPSNWYGFMNIRISSRDFDGVLGYIEEQVKGVVPDDPFSYSFLSEDVARSYQMERRTSQLVRYMTFLAMLISCLGLYGLASHSIARRTKEIAVRKTHGASVAGLVTLISREFVLLVAVSSAIAWPLAHYIMSRWLEDFAYRTSIGWQIPLVALGLTLVVVMATISFRSIRAASANPIEHLRHE